MEKCHKCSKNKEVFGRNKWCRDCRQEYDKAWYAKNFHKYKERKQQLQRDRNKNNRQYVWDYLKSHPCVDCGEKDPIVLEFDHRGDKENTICVLAGTGASLKTLKKEISKCDVRCANCHRKKTAIQLNYYRDIKK